MIQKGSRYIQATTDSSKLCLVIDENDNIFAWAEPYIVDGVVKPSLGANGAGKSVMINKSDIPVGIKLGDCKYIDGKVVYSPERAEFNVLADLRAERQEELAKYDKYQLPYLQARLTEEQIQEYNEWRQAWLDITETKVKPERPEWFDKI